jgi:hypothetical protein
MKILKRTIIIALLPFCFLLLLALPVLANGQISESPLSDIMTVYAPDGSIFAQIGATEADEVTNGPGFIYFLPNVAVDPSQFGNYTMFYEQGGNPTDGPWSDIFGIATGGPDDLNLAFASDVDNVPFPYASLAEDAYAIVEENPGVPYDMTMYLSPDLREAGYTATFVSDANVVPEPSTFLLLGAGFVGVGLFRRRFKK